MNELTLEAMREAVRGASPYAFCHRERFEGSGSAVYLVMDKEGCRPADYLSGETADGDPLLFLTEADAWQAAYDLLPKPAGVAS
jgi:hypothetical protein